MSKTLKALGTVKSCTCDKCVGACNNSPGWFLPGEAEKSAKLLGMAFGEFKKKYLIQEFWCGDPEIDVLAPRKKSQRAGFRRATWGSAWLPSPCVFLKRKRCMIHEAKPHECRMALCCVNNDQNIREEIAKKWANILTRK